jgi:acyl carrier protein
MGAEWQPPTAEEAAAARAPSARNLLPSDASPADRMRAELADIISGATGIPLSQLAPDAPLAELGVGSLQALQIVGEVQERYGVALDPTLWFEGLTLQQMVDETAKLAEGGAGAAASANAAAVAAAAAAAAAGEAQPASFNQAQMFVLDSKGAGASLNIPFALDLRGQLQLVALLKALDALAARHDALRAHFTVRDGAPAVVYAPAPPSPGAFAPRLVRAPLPDGGDAAVAAAIEAEATRPFSLLDGPLLRLLLLESPQRNVLVVTTHHAISDGWSGGQGIAGGCTLLQAPVACTSHRRTAAAGGVAVQLTARPQLASVSAAASSPPLAPPPLASEIPAAPLPLLLAVRVLMNDLAAAYSAFVRGEEPSLPPVPATYAAYATWQHQQAEQGAWDADLDYWRGRLLGAPSHLALPYRKAGASGSAAAAGPGASVPLFLPKEVVAGLSALAGRSGTTLFSVLAAAVSALLMRYADQDDVTLGIPFSGREAGPAPLLRQVGYYVNTLVLRMAADPAQPFEELVAAAKAEVQAATSHGGVPFQQVATRAAPRGSQPFQVYLVHQDYRLLQVAPFDGLEVCACCSAAICPAFCLPLHKPLPFCPSCR